MRYFKSIDGTFKVLLRYFVKKYQRYIQQYNKSTNGTFFITFLKKYIPMILVFGNVIRDFSKGIFCSFRKQYFW